MATFSSVDAGFVPSDRLVLRGGVWAYLGGYRGEIRVHTWSDLQVFPRWCTARTPRPARRGPGASVFRSEWSAMIAHMSLGPERVALVTGSSRGLGAAIARRLGRDGLAVAVNSLHGDAQALEVARTIRDDGGISDVFPADVTDERQVAELVTAVTDRLGPIDVLVLNATGPQPEASVPGVTWDDHIAQLNFFVKSPVLLGQAVLPEMQTRRFGRIVHVDSEVVHRPPPGRTAYVTAKAAQVGLTRSWAR